MEEGEEMLELLAASDAGGYDVWAVRCAEERIQASEPLTQSDLARLYAREVPSIGDDLRDNGSEFIGPKESGR